MEVVLGDWLWAEQAHHFLWRWERRREDVSHLLRGGKSEVDRLRKVAKVENTHSRKGCWPWAVLGSHPRSETGSESSNFSSSRTAVSLRAFMNIQFPKPRPQRWRFSWSGVRSEHLNFKTFQVNLICSQGSGSETA